MFLVKSCSEQKISSEEVCTCTCAFMRHTLRVQKYGNEGPKNLFSKIAYITAQKVCNSFSMEAIADVTKMNSYVNKHFYF